MFSSQTFLLHIRLAKHLTRDDPMSAPQTSETAAEEYAQLQRKMCEKLVPWQKVVILQPKLKESVDAAIAKTTGGLHKNLTRKECKEFYDQMVASGRMNTTGKGHKANSKERKGATREPILRGYKDPLQHIFPLHCYIAGYKT